ncbi:MAG: M48 family metallopeptidase [Verrucomicrobia bacterium]|nr:M48 family metallopeptidase [Verrucomicrobiota bacterium]
MSLDNPWFLLALIATLGLYHLELFATLLNLSALKPEPPESLRATTDQDTHERALEYARVSAKLGIIESSVSLTLMLGFWWLGGFNWLDQVIRGWHLTQIVNGLAVISLVFLARQLVSFPFEVYDTFVIERGFGFNKTTPATFLLDRIKGLVLLTALGLPILALLLWLFNNSDRAALYGWLAVSSFSLLMSFIAPRLIMPMFFKFTPLEDVELRKKIDSLSLRLAFPVSDVSVVDGSRRSTKANAFFAGFGKAKRIALFDTLLKNHTHDEILAVLAHEIGHCKRRHVPQQIVLSLAASALMFALLHYALRDPQLCAAFGIGRPSIAWGLVFFSIAYQPLNQLLSLIGGHLSRKFEFEADAYAKAALDSATPMVNALTKLSRDHLSNPTPHPFYVFLHYSHPPVLQRVAALEN